MIGLTSLLVVCVVRNPQESTMELPSAKDAKDSSGDGWSTGMWPDW